MKIIFTLFIITAVSMSLFAQGLELKPYGFLKGDAVYSSKGVLSFGNPNLSAPSEASGVDAAALGFTAKHSRVGLKGTYGEDIKVGGVVEIDFFSTNGFDTNVNPRLRLAYASLAIENWDFKIGQQWDIFSPLNPNTVNTNANLWNSGNLGFRRGQILIGYKIPAKDFESLLQLSLGEAAKETGSGLGDDNKSVMPMIQGRASAKFLEDKTVGIYFVFAKFSPYPDSADYDYNTNGFGADFTLPFHKYFNLHGEINTGTNLNNSNFFSVAGNGSKDDERKILGFWANITSNISDHFQLVLGGGMEDNQSDNIADGNVKQNFVIYGDLVFPIAYGFSLSLELGNISTTYQEMEGNGDVTHSALYGFLSGKVVF